MSIGDKLNIDGKEVEWNGFSLLHGGIFAVPFDHMPTEAEARLVLLGWKYGYQEGKNAGRAILQNDFRNLMGLQR